MIGRDYEAEALQILDRARWNAGDFANARVVDPSTDDDYWHGLVTFEQCGRTYSLPVHTGDSGDVVLYAAGGDIDIGADPEHLWMMLYYEDHQEDET